MNYLCSLGVFTFTIGRSNSDGGHVTVRTVFVDGLLRTCEPFLFGGQHNKKSINSTPKVLSNRYSNGSSLSKQMTGQFL